MTLVDGNIKFDDSPYISWRGVTNFRRAGDFVEFRCAFDTTRQRRVRARADSGANEWWITVAPDVRCELDESYTMITLAHGRFETPLPVNSIVQVGERFFFTVRSFGPGGRDDVMRCINDRGDLLWSSKQDYLGVGAAKDSMMIYASLHAGGTDAIHTGTMRIVQRTFERGSRPIDYPDG